MHKLSLPSASGTWLVRKDDISNIISEGERYCWVVMTNGKRKLIHITLYDLIEKLPKPPFYQVNDSTIIHISQLKQVLTEGGMQVVLLSGASFPVSAEMIEQLGG